MPHVMVTIKPDGSKEVVRQKGKFTLAQLQKAVGGYIELLPSFRAWYWDASCPGNGRRCEAYVDEDGHSKQLACNTAATSYYAIASGRTVPFLVGNMVVIYQD